MLPTSSVAGLAPYARHCHTALRAPTSPTCSPSPAGRPNFQASAKDLELSAGILPPLLFTAAYRSSAQVRKNSLCLKLFRLPHAGLLQQKKPIRRSEMGLNHSHRVLDAGHGASNDHPSLVQAAHAPQNLSSRQSVWLRPTFSASSESHRLFWPMKALRTMERASCSRAKVPLTSRSIEYNIQLCSIKPTCSSSDDAGFTSTSSIILSIKKEFKATRPLLSAIKLSKCRHADLPDFEMSAHSNHTSPGWSWQRPPKGHVKPA